MKHFVPFSALLIGVQAAVIDVNVGGPGVLKFNPEFVTANVGDTVRFHFQQKNHTVTQSSFESPCVHLDQGFDSGFVPVADSVTDNFPLAELNVTTTSPIWAFCRQANHCQQGMVFAVNPGDKFAAFQAAATGATTTTTSSSTPTQSVITVTTTITTSNNQTVTSTYVTSPGSATPTSVPSTDHKIIVGGTGGIQTFSPSNITAQPGDTLTFEFHQKNHTATQSSFAAPCKPLAQTSNTGAVGFDSGFMFVADNATTFPTYTIQVNDTAPIWVYCAQQNHCGNGMVFSVNAIESGPNSFEAFQAKAKTLNGTKDASSSATPALSRNLHGAGIVFTVVAVLFGFLL